MRGKKRLAKPVSLDALCLALTGMPAKDISRALGITLRVACVLIRLEADIVGIAVEMWRASNGPSRLRCHRQRRTRRNGHHHGQITRQMDCDRKHHHLFDSRRSFFPHAICVGILIFDFRQSQSQINAADCGCALASAA